MRDCGGRRCQNRPVGWQDSAKCTISTVHFAESCRIGPEDGRLSRNAPYHTCISRNPAMESPNTGVSSPHCEGKCTFRVILPTGALAVAQLTAGPDGACACAGQSVISRRRIAPRPGKATPTARSPPVGPALSDALIPTKQMPRDASAPRGITSTGETLIRQRELPRRKPQPRQEPRPPEPQLREHPQPPPKPLPPQPPEPQPQEWREHRDPHR